MDSTQMNCPSRRQLVGGMIGLATVLSSASALAAPPVTRAMTIFRDSGCGCCLKWAAHATRAGFTTRIVDAPNMAAVKRRLGVPETLASCHTAVVDGLVIEGHVPLEAVTALLRKRSPGVRGVAVAGMPIGSPGMESPDGRRDPLAILTFDSAGRTRPLR